MKQATIKLNDGQEFIIKNSMNTIMIFEEISGKNITEIKSTKDYLQWLYATLVGCNEDTFKYTWKEFINIIDENPHIAIEFNAFNRTPELIQPKAEKKSKKKTGKPINSSELYAIAVKMGVQPQYFLHKMEMYELKAIIELYESDYKENWNKERIIAHSIYQSQSSKALKYTDVLAFPWDEDDVEISKAINPAERERLKQYVLDMQAKMNASNNSVTSIDR